MRDLDQELRITLLLWCPQLGKCSFWSSWFGEVIGVGTFKLFWASMVELQCFASAVLGWCWYCFIRYAAVTIKCKVKQLIWFPSQFGFSWNLLNHKAWLWQELELGKDQKFPKWCFILISDRFKQPLDRTSLHLVLSPLSFLASKVETAGTMDRILAQLQVKFTFSRNKVQPKDTFLAQERS